MAAGAAQNRIFISCVTKEFSALRGSLRRYLSRADCEVKVQEDFRQTPEDTVEKLDGYIRSCAAVIHLVGQASGAVAEPAAVRSYLASFNKAHPFLGNWPELRAALGDFSGISYTQWEAFVALHHGINPFVYQATSPHGGYVATDADRASQLQHIQRLLLGRRYALYFAGESDLLGQLIGDLCKILPAIPGHQPFNLPGSIGPLFKGREDFLKKLHDTLNAAHGVAAISAPRAVHGLGGIGKTRTAIEYGHRFKHEYSALLLVRADTPESLRRNLAELTGPFLLNLPAAAAPDQDVRLAAALHWLEEHPRWFLILDNVDNEAAAREVESLLGNLRGGHIVIATRLSTWSGQVEALDLEVLGEEAAVDFLLTRTAGRRQATATDATDVRTLAGELGNLPLALEQAGAYISERRISFAAYLRRWHEGRATVLSWFNERTMRYPSSVAVTWATTFERISPTARALLQILASLSSAPIQRALLETNEAASILALAKIGPDPMELPTGEAPSAFAMEAAVAELANYSLVRYLDEPPASFSMHRLVQEIVRLRLSESARVENWKMTVGFVEAYAPGGGQDISTWPRWMELAPHLEVLFKRAQEQANPEPIPKLLLGFAGFLQYRNASYSAAESLVRRALESRERMLSPEHPDTLNCVNNLATLLRDMGEYDGAERLCRRALGTCELVLGPEHPDTICSVNNLAILLKEKGDYGGAELLCRRAMEGLEHAFGPLHPATLTSAQNLAILLRTRGDYDGAEPLYRWALEARVRVLGQDHPNTLISVNQLASLLQGKGDYSGAEQLFRQALNALERVLGSEHPDSLTCVNNLASLLQAKGDYEEAEQLLRRALDARERLLGPAHRDTLISLNNLASLLEAKEGYGMAEPLYRRALKGFEEVLGTHHPSTKIVRENWETCRERLET